MAHEAFEALKNLSRYFHEFRNKYFVNKNCDIYDERINDKKFIICLYYYVEKNILTRRA